MLFFLIYPALALFAGLLTSTAEAGLVFRPDELVGASAEQAAQAQALDAGASDLMRNGTAAPVRVNVTLGVMSRCPDAISAEAAFQSVIDRVNEKVQLEFSYIGSIDKEEDYGVSCMHGPQECAGNIQQLCVQHILRPSRAGRDFDLSPSAAQRKVWDFVSCQDYDGAAYIGSPSLAKECLSTIRGPRWIEDGVKDCIEGKQGRKLLQESVKRSQKLGIVKSATIQLEGETICVRDGGQWKECKGGHETRDFVRQIEEAWDEKMRERRVLG